MSKSWFLRITGSSPGDQLSGISTTIAGAVEGQAATTTQIGQSVTEVAGRNGEISASVASVAEGARSTTSAISEVGKATSELARMAAELDRLVGLLPPRPHQSFRHVA